MGGVELPSQPTCVSGAKTDVGKVAACFAWPGQMRSAPAAVRAGVVLGQLRHMCRPQLQQTIRGSDGLKEGVPPPTRSPGICMEL